MTEHMDMSRRSVLRNLLAAGVAVPLLAVSASSCTARGGLREVTVAGGENGGFYLEFATLLAEALQRRGIAETAKPLVTGGSLENLELLRSGKATFAVALADAASRAASDKGTGTAPAMAAVGKVYENYVHCIVRKDSGIGGLDELAGRTVSTGEPRSGTSLTAARILETFAAGMPAFAKNPPVKRSLGLNKGLAALRDGTVDALFWSGGVPTAAIAALNKELGLAFLDLSSVIRPMRERFGPFYDRVRIPEGSYAGAPAAWTVGVANLLLCRMDLDDHTMEQTVELLVTRAGELVPQSSAGVQFLSPDTLINTAGIPLHPAAERAYRELHG
ncbi:C4-dicarboxylate ABC transporter substrate-binding protein [Arthrobacter sp. SW1]|uniref:TAXI family TRAP transporter solute-binding subunit n=1 Tax=Arthrobacter sp. SW1 TaxID=1920889 RepID=UPI000877C6EA|nr:TAXI family TRAP transporter solute-binding subunit [Arthrobacter sp. SW1]OFI38550.1 C4-dicarboxylate ABC transporter substrate-binding protein [Arthrobacter sp. SW1]